MQLQKNSIKKIILGTAQLGLNYGVNKYSYDVSYSRAEEILFAAFDHGIETLDTATGYGKSHEYIKKFHEKHSSKKFKVFSKISLKDLHQGQFNIHNELGTDSLEGLMLHSASESKNLELIKVVKNMKEVGVVKQLGLSLYYDPDFKELVQSFDPDFVQIPFNVLDNDKLRDKEFNYLSLNKINIQTRSTFMRGALTHFKEGSYPIEISSEVKQLQMICKKFDISPMALCLNFSLRNPNVDHVVLGVDSVENLKECLETTSIEWKQGLDEAIYNLGVSNPEILDLRKWP